MPVRNCRRYFFVHGDACGSATDTPVSEPTPRFASVRLTWSILQRFLVLAAHIRLSYVIESLESAEDGLHSLDEALKAFDSADTGEGMLTAILTGEKRAADNTLDAQPISCGGIRLSRRTIKNERF